MNDIIVEIRENNFKKIFTELGKNLYEEIQLQKAKKISNKLKKFLAPAVSRAEIVGSVARSHPIVKDIDLVVVPKVNLKEYLKNKKIRISSGREKAITFNYKGVSVNVWSSSDSDFGASVLHFSAGKAIIHLKNEAKRRGMTLNRYGLWKGNKKIAGKDYKEILKILEASTKFVKMKAVENAIAEVPPKLRKKFIKQGQFPRETTNWLRFRQLDPNDFDKSSFRTIKDSSGNAKIKGRLAKDNIWRAQSILINKKNVNKNEVEEYLASILA